MSQNELLNKMRNAFLSAKIRVWDKTFKLKIFKRKADHYGPESAQWEKFSPFVQISIRSADEKLRSIGHNKHQNNRPIVNASKERQDISESKTIQHIEPANEQTIEKLPDDSDMAERKIYRQGRKDLQGTNEKSSTEQTTIKHRSRSEGPSGRLKPRNSMDERKINSGQDKCKSSSLTTSQSARHSICTDPVSDDGAFPEDSSTDTADSDENRPKKWVKNPLLLKKKQKLEKRKSFQNGETGSVGNKENNLKPEVPSRKSINRSPQLSNRDVYIYQEKNNGQKAKYQKLEERRNKRVDMTVTSDEELNSPEFRISRLRQRALQEAKIATKLPDYLEEYVPSEQKSVQSVRNQQQRNEQVQVENGSSSSEQITLKPIGPSQRDFSSYDSYRQWECDNNNANIRTQIATPNYSNYGNKPIPPERAAKNIQSHGSYRKIPRQDMNYIGNLNVKSVNSDSIPVYVQGESKGQGQSGFVKQQNMNYNKISPPKSLDLRTKSNPSFYDGRDGYSDKEISFQEVKTKEPVVMKKAIGRVDKKRKSQSDDDSLDELIESNIQYLESEIESGRLKKMTVNQPVMFPISGVEMRRTSDKEKRRSSSLDSVTRPVQSSYQNEVKLRLQVPPVTRSSYRSNQFETYDNRTESYNNPKMIPHSSQTSQSVVRPHEILYQNTVPVERRFQSASHSPYLQRRSTAELANMEDMSKSESQLNTVEFGIDYRRPVNYKNQQFQQSHMMPRPPFSSHDTNMASERDSIVKSLSVPGMESGMFSDVDYDIEVSERVKKWETFMKKKVDDPDGDKKPPVSLTTILESEGGVPDSWLSGQPVSPSVAVSSMTVTVTKSTTHLEPPPEPQPKILSKETSSHRVFRVVQHPSSNTFSKPSESSVTYIRSPSTRSAHHEPHGNDFNQNKHQTDNYDYDDGVNNDNNDNFTNVKQSWPPSDQELINKDTKKLARLSKYEEELSEIQVLKMDSVRDLRKRFDSDASGNESTDTREVITPVRLTPLRKRRHLVKSFEPSPSPPPNKEQYTKPLRPKVKEVEPPELVDISTVSSGVEPQNEELWSPKLESSKGLVSIERVTARTLQTIPFSEDPIWKQIEKMTSFDQLLASEALGLQSPSQQEEMLGAQLHRNSYIDIPSSAYSQTTTVTTTTAVYTPSEASEQLKTKPFTTPKIQPLKLSVNSKTSATALDEVLEDVRMSLHKKTDGSTSSLQSPIFVQSLQPSLPHIYGNSKEETNKQSVAHLRLSKPEANIQARQSMIDRELEPFMQSLLDQPVHDAPVQINPDFTQYPYVINGNYKLDPHLLKEKLMDTGLANMEDMLSTRSVTPVFSPTVTPVHQRYEQPQLQQQYQHYHQQQQQQEQMQQYIQQQRRKQQFQHEQQQKLKQQQFQHQQQQKLQQQQFQHDQQQKQQQQNWQQNFHHEKQQQQQQKHQNASAEAQMCKTMEDLKNLAKEVELKLSQIKYKIVDADESKLDSIILALKNFAPESAEKMDTPKVESTAEHTERQRKLSGALAELERIYENLRIDNDSEKQREPISQSQNHLYTASRQGNQSISTLNTMPKQNVIYSDIAHSQSLNNVYGSQPGMRRNKSDSDCTIKNLRGETLAEVERQTQREFDDINKSFQSLLAEVTQSDTSTKPVVNTSSHTAQIEATIDSLLSDLQKAADNRSSSQPVSKSSSTSRFTESLIDDLVNKQLATQNTCREIRKSEVFTTSSGPFSVLVGINGGGRKPRFSTKSSSAGSEQTVKGFSAYPQPEQDDVFTADVSELTAGQPRPKSKSSRVQIKMKKDLANRIEKKHVGVRQEDDCESDDSEEDKKVYRRCRRQANLQHRKSMPADILKKSVETQTFEAYTPVAVIKEKLQSINSGKSDSAGNYDSSSSDNYSGETKGPRKRKISKGIAVMMEIFSSSDDERSKQFPLVHSHSAPDLTELFDSGKHASRLSKPKKSKTPRFIKQRHEARARKKSSQSSKDDSTEEKVEEFSITSTTSDDGQMSQGSKPPVYPGRKQRSSSPDKVFSDSNRSENRAPIAVKIGSQNEMKDFGKTERRPNASASEVVLRKRVKKETRDDSPERPHSFHELLAAFETDPNHLNKLSYSLRKCASADSVATETMLNKCYHSESDLREDIPGSDASSSGKDIKLQVEVKVKQ